MSPCAQQNCPSRQSAPVTVAISRGHENPEITVWFKREVRLASRSTFLAAAQHGLLNFAFVPEPSANPVASTWPASVLTVCWPFDSLRIRISWFPCVHVRACMRTHVCTGSQCACVCMHACERMRAHASVRECVRANLVDDIDVGVRVECQPRWRFEAHTYSR